MSDPKNDEALLVEELEKVAGGMDTQSNCGCGDGSEGNGSQESLRPDSPAS